MKAPSLIPLLYEHWQLSPGLTVAALSAGSLYVGALARARGHWPVRRTLYFLAGILCVLVALDSGIGTYDETLLSVHMAQHMLLLLVAPLLLLLGLPAVVILRATPPRGRPGLARALGRMRGRRGAAASLVCFATVVIGTHVPGFYDATLRHPALHGFEHALYLMAGLLLWWPLLGSDPAPAHRLGGLGRLIYLLAAMVPMALVGAYLNRHATLVYPLYGPAARAVGRSPLADQAQAGAIMWVAGNVIMIAVGLSVTIGALVTEDRRQQGREARRATLVATRGPGS